MHARTVYQTRLHTRSNHLGMLSVGSDPNPTYKSCVDNCVESVIYSSESQVSLINWTSNDRIRTSRAYYISSELYTCFSIMYRQITNGSWSAHRRIFHSHPRCTIIICRRMQKTGIYISKSCANLVIGVLSDTTFQSCMPYRKSWCSARTRHVTRQLIIQIDRGRSVIDVKL